MKPLGLLHRAWRALPQQGRRRALARAVALVAPRPDKIPPKARAGIAVGGEINRASGLGEAARLMLHALRQLGVPSWSFEAGLSGGGGSVADVPPAAPLVLHLAAPEVPLALLRLGRAGVAGRRIIGYWPWELPVVSPDWQASAAFVHEIWAPSRFSAAALEPLRPGQVRVVPYPVAARPPVPATLDRLAFGLPADAVVTLCAFSLASSFERKNPLAAIAAHRQAFGARPDRVLLLKVHEPDHYPADMDRLRQAAGDLPNIRWETRSLPLPDHHALIAACDLVLSLHRSEGFGLVPAEAMLLGKPVVATGWSGVMDFMEDYRGQPCAALVPYSLVPAADPRGVFQAPGATWADADVGAAAAQLTRLADTPGARTTMGALARLAVGERLGVAPLARAVRTLGLPAGRL